MRFIDLLRRCTVWERPERPRAVQRLDVNLRDDEFNSLRPPENAAAQWAARIEPEDSGERHALHLGPEDTVERLAVRLAPDGTPVSVHAGDTLRLPALRDVSAPREKRD